MIRGLSLPAFSCFSRALRKRGVYGRRCRQSGDLRNLIFIFRHVRASKQAIRICFSFDDAADGAIVVTRKKKKKNAKARRTNGEHQHARVMSQMRNQLRGRLSAVAIVVSPLRNYCHQVIITTAGESNKRPLSL